MAPVLAEDRNIRIGMIGGCPKPGWNQIKRLRRAGRVRPAVTIDLLASSVSLGVALLHAPSARYRSRRHCLPRQYQHPFSALARPLLLLRAVLWCSEVPVVLPWPDDTATWDGTVRTSSVRIAQFGPYAHRRRSFSCLRRKPHFVPL